MKFTPLSREHIKLLLQFEQNNRTWFESFISSRGDDFYSATGVSYHIENAVQAMQQGVGYSGVLIEKGKIIGRGNLKVICSQDKSAYVGYRIGQSAVGKGAASFCLAKLVELASNQLRLSQLNAEVLDNNPASKRVLTKLGFEEINYQQDHSIINGVSLGCTLMNLDLSNK